MFKEEYQKLVEQPNAEAQLRQLLKVLCDMVDVAGYTPALDGESHDWKPIVSTVEENRANYCEALSWKTLYSALYGIYTVTLKLKGQLTASIFSEENKTTKGTE
jgi:hypothetical protein